MKRDPLGDLRAMYKRPLDEYAARRVVFWHDVDGSFEGEFEALAKDGIESARACSFAKAGEGSLFALKKRLIRDEATNDFLLYTRAPKDLTRGGLEGNWLADLELVAEHFQADFSSMLVDELGAADTAAEGIEHFKSFFGAGARKNRFVRLMPHAQTKEDVALGVMGTVLGAKDLSTGSLVRAYIKNLAEDKKPMKALAKYGADGAFAAFVKTRLGYEGDLFSLDDLMAHVSISALSCTMDQTSLSGLEDRMSAPHGQFCLNVLNDWMADADAAEDLYDLLRQVEETCGLEDRFARMSAQSLVDSDVMPCINERILVDLMGSLAQGADRADEATTIARRRKDLSWYARVEPYYDALGAAVMAQRFYREHTQGFHYAKAADVWKAYTSDWYRMDTSYRLFCRAFDECQLSAQDAPRSLDNALEDLASWMENVYTNWFLTDTNACWVNACERRWCSTRAADGVPQQGRFFEERVAAGAQGARKTLVVISDALRYEVAVELAERLERKTRGTTQLAAMQSAFPSITEFGMASLLPHTTISYDCASGAVGCDGLPTKSTQERGAVLARRVPKSCAIQHKELISTKRARRKALLGDAEVVYLYHNKIDATGEVYATEEDVFDACEGALEELVALVRIAVNDLSFGRIVITADHGFVYTRHPLEEKDKVGKGDIQAEAAKLGRRYAILNGKQAEDSLFVRIDMSDVAGGEYTGLSPRECIRIKKPGPGNCYVHGGASLQEVCVPVIQFRNRRSGSAGYVEQQRAELKLLSNKRRVSSMIFKVDLFQTSVVGGKVLPALYELVMCDASGNEVSNVVKAHADVGAENEAARVTHAQFNLKAGRSYGAKDTYYLVCREKDSKQMLWKEPFTIDIAFAPMDDFGF